MAHLEGFDFGIPKIEEIPVDHDQEAREYMIKMYERIKRLESPTTDAIQREILETTETSGSSTSLVYSNETLQRQIPELTPVKKLVEVDVKGTRYQAPIFNHANQWKGWTDILDYHEHRTKDILDKLRQVGKSEDVKKVVNNIHRLVWDWNPKDVKDKGKVSAIRRTIYLSAIENYIEQEIGEVGLKFQNVSASVDPITHGLWVKENASSEIQEYLEKLGTRRVVMNQRYRFNGQQTENLIKLMFSSRPDVRARAKLDLVSRIDSSIQQDLIRDAGKVLEIICAEAYLTQDEILHLVFQVTDKSGGPVCITCQTPVKLDKHVYHARCKIVDWLTTHARFSYEPSEQYLYYTRVVYIDGNKRALISSILKMHARLKRDIIYQSATETIIYKREDDGKLTRVEARRQRESDIIGSYAWRVRQGMTPPH